jgi:polysaccharide pyruvyl transferase CsaB
MPFTRPHPLKVGISGSYGGLNLGDEAILHGIVGELRATLPVEVTVFSRNAEDTRVRHQVERAVTVRELSREEARPEVARLDVLILGGGGLLYDASARTYLREVSLANELGVPVVVYAVGVGPLAEGAVRKAVHEALERVESAAVRDRRSRHLLEEIGVRREIHVTADPALLLDPAPDGARLLDREGLTADSPLIGLSVREPGEAAPQLDVGHYHQLLANAADFMVDRYGASLVFVPMEVQHDVQHGHAVIARMVNARRANVLKADYTAAEILALIGHFEFALGMRLHFLIFAALQGVPFLALPYGSKVSGFLDEFGLSMPRVGNLGAGQLISYIDRAWDTRRDLRARIAEVVPQLRERARETNRLVMRVLEPRMPASRSARDTPS